MRIKLLAVLTLMICSFIFGAYQHRSAGWPFGQNLTGQLEKLITASPATRINRKRLESTAGWIDQLKKGGYIIFIRHAHREKWPQDIAFDIHQFVNKIEDASQTSFRKGVCLSDMGEEEAKLLGKVFERIGIPVGDVFSSPSCRARQTAALAFGGHDVENSLSLVYSYNEKFAVPDPIVGFLQKVAIKPGKNTILVAHGGRLEIHSEHAIQGQLFVSATSFL